MEGHEHHRVVLLVVAVQIADQGHLFQVPRQAGLGTFLVGVGAHAGYQLTQVFQAGLALLPLGFQHGLVTGKFNHLVGKLIQRQRIGLFGQLVVQFAESPQRTGGPAQRRIIGGMAADFQHTAAQTGGDLGELVHRGAADLTGRFVDDPLQAQIVPGIGQDGHVGQNVLDLLAVKEPLAAHNFIGNARPGKIGFNGAGLGVHPVEHGTIPQAAALFQVFGDNA